MNNKYLEVIELLDKYDLLLEQLECAMKDGFFNLSRSNYYNKNSLRGSYGKDYWDNTYIGQQFVRVDGTILLKRDLSELDKTSEDDIEKDNQLKNRKCSGEKKKKPRITNPLYMFGSILSIPNTLRQSQSNFESCIPLLLEIASCKNQINQIITILKKTK